jgi:MarR family transcriptional regulator, organic hydroperoxide resistance regulator
LTTRLITSILEILQKRTTATPRPEALDRQSSELLGYLDSLFRKLMLPRRSAEESPDEPSLEISREEIRALIILDSGQRIIMSNLAEALGVPLSTATHTVDRLVAKALVVRNRSEKDRRVVQVEMSDYGRKLQASHTEKRRFMARSWLEPLTSTEREIFLKLMDKITLLAKPAGEESVKK